jgi:phosphocarrier protein HPr
VFYLRLLKRKIQSGATFMNSSGQSLSRDVIIVNELGLHARSAAKFAKTAGQASGRVWVQKEDEQVDGKQVIDILTLAAARGDALRITVEASADINTLAELVELVDSGFGE